MYANNDFLILYKAKGMQSPAIVTEKSPSSLQYSDEGEYTGVNYIIFVGETLLLQLGMDV